MPDESKPEPEVPGGEHSEPQSKPLPDPPTDAPPPDPTTTPKPPGEPEVPGPPPEPAAKRDDGIPVPSALAKKPDADKPAGTPAVVKPAAPPARVAEPEAPDAVEEPGEVGLGTRVGAAVIDLLVALALYTAAIIVLPQAIEGTLGWLLMAAYLIGRDSLAPLGGQSLGKTALKLKVVKISGGNLVNDWQNALLRNVLLVIPFGSLIELVVLMVREGKPEAGRRLGDEWAKTKVVPAGEESVETKEG